MLNGTMGLFRGTNFDLPFLRNLEKDDVSKQSHNIDSRVNITTFFNFPDMFRRYIRHLQCYIF